MVGANDPTWSAAVSSWQETQVEVPTASKPSSFGLEEGLDWLQKRQMFQLESLQKDFEFDANKDKHLDVWYRCFLVVTRYHERQNQVASRFLQVILSSYKYHS